MTKRVYVCHTYYHIYVTLLKELNMEGRRPEDADIVLSTISTDLREIAPRLEESGLFRSVYVLDEKKDSFFEGLMHYKEPCGNVVKHLINRIIYTRRLARLEEPYMTVDFSQYEEVYVFCDSDPIGYYLNYKHIHYHALEDGLDCLRFLDGAHYDNRGHFGLKKFLASIGLIHIQNGYSRYCLDMEVNDISVLRHRCPKYVEVKRAPLEAALSPWAKGKMLGVFLEDADELLAKLREHEDCCLFLPQPHPAEHETRFRIAEDIMSEYMEGSHVVIKPHPRDDADFAGRFDNCTVIRGRFPIEVLNFIEGLHFKRAVSVASTAIDTIKFADEKILLGWDFMDRYEDPSKHDWSHL